LWVTTAAITAFATSKWPIRQSGAKLIEDRVVDVVVAVGPNFFYTVTLPVTLWFFDRGIRGTEREEKVLFIDARKIFRQCADSERNEMEKSKVIGALAIAGAAIASFGTLLPFVTMQTIFGSFSINFIDGDGKFVVLAGAVMAAAGIAYLFGKRLWPLIGLGALGGLFVLVTDTANLNHAISSANLGATSPPNLAAISSANLGALAQVEPGIGLYLCWIGMLIALASAVWGAVARYPAIRKSWPSPRYHD
jgi:hypothetical protein